MGTVPANFHGVKGRSGRPTARVEKNKMQALERAWKKVNDSVDGADVKEIALPLALKDLTTKTALVDKNGNDVQPILVQFMSACDSTENNPPAAGV